MTEVCVQPPPTSPRTLDPVQLVGRGAYATCLRVVDRATNETYALKRPHRGLDLESEYAALRAIGDHAYIVRVHDIVFADLEQTRRGILMEYCLHGSMFNICGKTNIGACRRLAHQLFLALRHVHSMGFLHRDVTPSNVLIDDAGDVKLADFGMARTRARTMTTCVTTVWYRAPKLLQCSEDYCEYGEEVDLYAFGCTVAELVDGVAPFRGASEKENDEQQRVSQLRVALANDWKSRHPETKAFVRLCMSCTDGSVLEGHDYFTARA